MFAGSAADKLGRLRAELSPLAARYDVVVANPPYMGSSNMGKWMGSWVKGRFPEAYRDLCTSFIDRGFSLSKDDGYSAMVTMQSWMFLGSYEKLRGKILNNHSISSMAHLGTRAFGAIGGKVVSTTATVFSNRKSDAPDAYFRLIDMGSEDFKQAGLLEALANPDCGWFFRRSADTFSAIPGSPIAYWFADAFFDTFLKGSSLSDIAKPRVGLQTSDNNRFLRYWFECGNSSIDFDCKTPGDSIESNAMWYPHNKGGSFCRWYGNCEYVINYGHNSAELDAFEGASTIPDDLIFKEAITYSRISSGEISFRKQPEGMVFGSAAVVFFPPAELFSYKLALMNTSLISKYAEALVQTLNAQPSDISKIPVLIDAEQIPAISPIVEDNVMISVNDWNSLECSWGFRKHPLI